MVKKEKLSQFYFTQYREGTARYKKKNQDGKAGYAKRAKSLSIELQRIKSGHVKEAKLEDYHRQVRNLCYFAFKQNNQVAIMQIRDFLLPELVRLDLAAMKPSEQEIVTERFLDYLRNEMNGELCVRTLKDLTVSYAEYGIREQIIDLVPLKPETEFPKARAMQRHFILHIGPTNCGKTYHALTRLKDHSDRLLCGLGHQDALKAGLFELLQEVFRVFLLRERADLYAPPFLRALPTWPTSWSLAQRIPSSKKE